MFVWIRCFCDEMEISRDHSNGSGGATMAPKSVRRHLVSAGYGSRKQKTASRGVSGELSFLGPGRPAERARRTGGLQRVSLVLSKKIHVTARGLAPARRVRVLTFF